MATLTMSRFACLLDDVDDDYSNRKRRPPTAKKPDASKPQAAANVKSNNNKKKKNKENSQVQHVKSKGEKVKPESSGAPKKNKEIPLAQWEEWKEKDDQLVDDKLKNDLTQAILLSKLDYEEKKDFYERTKTVEPKPPELVERKGGKKPKKTIKVLSVEEFHNLGKVKSREDSPSVEKEVLKPDPEFFTRLQSEVKTELSKEKKNLPKKPSNVREPFSEEALTMARTKDVLDKKIKEVDELREENNSLKEELKDVKTRNKKLCHILANGEMKDKAEVLAEVERLQTVRDELLEQVASLHAQLEQERSKVRALTNDSKSKDKNKKRTTSASDQ